MNPETTPRTLPIRIPPLPGEALDSWLEHLSSRLRTTHGDILAAVGLDRPAVHAARAQHTTSLPAGAAEAISAATVVTAEQVHAMTLARYGIAGGVLSLAVKFPRSRPRYSRFCPHSLNDDRGRWQLHWRLGYSFACLTHQCLLADACPDCGKAQRDRVFPGECVPAPGLCGHRARGSTGRLARRCGADLRGATTLPLVGDHPALHAQRLIDTAIDHGAAAFGVYRDQPACIGDFLADLRALGARALSPAVAAGLAELIPSDLRTAYRSTAASRRPAARPLAMLTAVALTAAMAVLGEDDLHAAAARLTRLENLTQQNGASLDWPRARWARDTSTTVTALRLTARAHRLTPLIQLRYRIGTPHPARTGHRRQHGPGGPATRNVMGPVGRTPAPTAPGPHPPGGLAVGDASHGQQPHQGPCRPSTTRLGRAVAHHHALSANPRPSTPLARNPDCADPPRRSPPSLRRPHQLPASPVA